MLFYPSQEIADQALGTRFEVLRSASTKSLEEPFF